MRRRGTHRAGLAMMALAAGLLWYAGGPAGAQEGPKGPFVPPPPGGAGGIPPGSAPAVLGPPGSAPAVLGPPILQEPQPKGCGDKGGDQKKKECKSPWA